MDSGDSVDCSGDCFGGVRECNFEFIWSVVRFEVLLIRLGVRYGSVWLGCVAVDSRVVCGVVVRVARGSVVRFRF